MSLINGIIYQSNFELVRSRIASILADEFNNQITLNQDALNAENEKPNPDEEVIANLELNLSAIPSVVWEERFRRPEPSEHVTKPLVNVIFTSAPLNELQTISTQSGDNVYVIEVYAGNKASAGENDKSGDSKAAIKLQRTLALCRSILMSPNYGNLGFDNPPLFIGKVSANALQIGQPDDGGDNGENTIRGKLNLTVKISETVEQLTGVALALNETTVKLYDTEKGYYWTNESN